MSINKTGGVAPNYDLAFMEFVNNFVIGKISGDFATAFQKFNNDFEKAVEAFNSPKAPENNIGDTGNGGTTYDVPQAIVELKYIDPDTGDVGNDFITSNTQPKFWLEVTEGALASGDKVVISFDMGLTWTDVTANYDAAKGMYYYEPTSPLDFKSYNVTVAVSDSGGTIGTTVGQKVEILAKPTVFGTIESYYDDVGSSTGNFGSGVVTDDRTIRLEGKVSAPLNTANGEKLFLYEGTTRIGEVTVDAAGNWTYDILGILENNSTHSYHVVIEDKAGSFGPKSNDFDVTVGLSITVDTLTTEDTTPLLTGKLGFELLAGENILITVNGKNYSSKSGQVIIDKVNNTWSLQIPADAELTHGKYDIVAVLQKDNGSTIVNDTTFEELTVLNSAPTTVGTIDSYFDNVGSVQGNFGSGVSTDDRTIRLQGKVSAALNTANGEKLVLYEGTTRIGEVTVDAAGNWSYNVPGVLENNSTYSYHVVVENSAGKFGPESNVFDVTVGLSITVDTLTTEDTTPLITGNLGFELLPTENIVIIVDGKAYNSKDGQVIVDSSNNTWSLQIPDNAKLSPSKYDVVAFLLKDNGAVIVHDNTFEELTIEKPILDDISVKILAYDDNFGTVWGNLGLEGYGSQTGRFGSGVPTDDRTTRILGEISRPLAAGEKVVLYEGTTRVGEATSFDPYTNVWGITVPYVLTNWKHHIFHAVIEDSTGKQGPKSKNFDVYVDCVITIDTMVTDDTTPTLSGKMGFEVLRGEYVTISVNNKSYSSKYGQVVLDHLKNTWKLTIPDAHALTNGKYNVVALLHKADGSIVTVDNTMNELTVQNTGQPGASANYGTILAYQDNFGSSKGDFSSNVATDDRTVRLIGNIAQPLNIANGEKLVLYSGTTRITELKVFPMSQSWYYDIPGVLSNGKNSFHVVVENHTGKQGPKSSIFDVYVDLNISVDALTTNSKTPTITGKMGFELMPGEYLTVVVNNKLYTSAYGHVVVDPWTNTWSLKIPASDALGDGQYNVMVHLRKADGSVIVTDHSTNELTVKNSAFNMFSTRMLDTETSDHDVAAGAAHDNDRSATDGNNTFVDNADDNIFHGREGNDVFTLSNGGHDTLVYDLDSLGDNSGGSDTAYGFTIGNVETNADADIIDLSGLLIGYNADSDINDYLSVEHQGNDTVLKVDIDGAASDYSSTSLLTLVNVGNVELDTLMQNHQIIV